MSVRADLVWPWWVRLSHWLVAAGVISLWLMSYLWYETDTLHRTLGYGVVAIVIARLLLGLRTRVISARISLPSRRALCLHWAEIRQGNLSPQRGHNPAGQWAVAIIWTLIAALALSGWLSRTDAFWGEDWPVDWHAALSWMLLGMVVLHVIAVAVVSHVSRQRLVRQMWHGRFDRQ